MTTEYIHPVTCQNCGHPQHCGTPLWREEKDYGTDDEPYQIKVCEHCRCKDCIKK